MAQDDPILGRDAVGQQPHDLQLANQQAAQQVAGELAASHTSAKTHGDIFTRIMAFLLGFLFIAVGLALVMMYFEVFGPRNLPEGQDPQQIGKFGIYFVAMGLAGSLALFFGERYGVSWGWISFGGSLAALFITLYFTWPYLFPEIEPVTPDIPEASIGGITFDIRCDIALDTPSDSKLVATLAAADNRENMIISELLEHYRSDERLATQFIRRSDHNRTERYFRDRHVLMSNLGQANKLFVPCSIREFSVVRTVGHIATEELETQREDLSTKHLFDIRLKPDSENNLVDIEVVVDLSQNTS